MLGVSDATFYRYKKVLKQLGFSITTVALEIPKCNFNFKDYWVYLNNEQTGVNKFFKIFTRLFIFIAFLCIK